MKHFKAASAGFLNDEKFSDFSVVCGASGREYKVHRLLVSSQSVWFNKCCSGDFAEGQKQRVVLQEDHPLALERMYELELILLQYFSWLMESRQDRVLLHLQEFQ